MAAFMPREMLAAVRTVASGRFSRYASAGTSRVTKFERQLEAMMQAPHALAVNGGTSALECALVGVGIGPGDEVLLPAYTWSSSAAACLSVGALPVLVDIDESLTIDLADLKDKVTPHSKAVMPVHMLNLVADMDGVGALAAQHNLKVVEDACQAVGLVYRGRRVGTIGDVGAFSFNQHKNIKAGEGGAVLSVSDRVHARARMYHDVGSYTRADRFVSDEPIFIGHNLRMPEISAAILMPQLKRLDAQLARRAKLRAVALEELSKSTRFTISPHHDPENAISLTVLLPTKAEAIEFAHRKGAVRVSEHAGHIFTNWVAVLERRMFDQRVDPYRRLGRDMADPRDTCPRTIDILERTCRIVLEPNIPGPVVREVARRLAK